MISKRTVDIDEEMCACFTGWQKASNRVNWTELMQILKGIAMIWCERRFISKQYVEQSVHLRLEHGKKTSVKTGRGVREGCCLLPVLFNFQSEYLIHKVLEGSEDFKTGEQVTRNVKYRDDIALLAREETVLQDKIDRLKLEDATEWKLMWKMQGDENLKAAIPNTDDRSK